MNRLKGFFYGLATSVTFGLIPLFTMPLMQGGMPLDSILFYRFLFATLALAGMMKLHKESFRIERRDLPILLLLAFSTWPPRNACSWGTTTWEREWPRRCTSPIPSSSRC